MLCLNVRDFLTTSYGTMLNRIKLYGIQVIETRALSVIYEAVIFDNYRPSTSWCIKILNPITIDVIYEEGPIKQLSDTCLRFTLSTYYDPQLYEFELEEL